MKHNIDEFDLSKQQVLDLIDAYIFNERNRQIVIRRLIDGVCYEDLADEYGLSVNHVKTVSYKAIEKISAHAKDTFAYRK
jgi:DNA-directed RNA polymerase specialized sigma24 family protein